MDDRADALVCDYFASLGDRASADCCARPVCDAIKPRGSEILDAISFDDTSQSFSGLLGDSAHSELGAAMTRVLTQLRVVRSEREEQARYFQTLIAHVPVALISADERGGVQLLNVAARRLFGTALSETAQFSRHGEAFAVGMESIRREPPRSYGWSGQPALCSSR